MRETRTSGSEGGVVQSNALSLPLSFLQSPFLARKLCRYAVAGRPRNVRFSHTGMFFPICMSFGQQPGNFHPPGRAWRYLIAEFPAQLSNLPLTGEAPDF